MNYARKLNEDCTVTILSRPYSVGERVNVYVPFGNNEDCVVVKICPKNLLVHSKVPISTLPMHYKNKEVYDRTCCYVPYGNVYVAKTSPESTEVTIYPKVRTWKELLADPRVRASEIWREDDNADRAGQLDYWIPLADEFNNEGCSCIHEFTKRACILKLNMVTAGEPS